MDQVLPYLAANKSIILVVTGTGLVGIAAVAVLTITIMITVYYGHKRGWLKGEGGRLHKWSERLMQEDVPLDDDARRYSDTDSADNSALLAVPFN